MTPRLFDNEKMDAPIGIDGFGSVKPEAADQGKTPCPTAVRVVIARRTSSWL